MASRRGARSGYVRAMRIHHVDCASMCPIARRLTNGDGGLFERGVMPSHCLIVETDAHGVVLVDTGLGEPDARDPHARLGAFYTAVAGVDGSRVTTMRAHLARLGLDPSDVRHILVTHLDLDHAGGLSDFPDAKVHVHADERRSALQPAWNERARYKSKQFTHGPRWSTYEATGERWRGFAAARALDGLPPEFLAIPMSGHSRGHSLFAIETPEGPLVHCGDAYFHRGAIEGIPVPFGLAALERLEAYDRRKIETNHARLRELAQSGGGVRLFSAHDPVEFERFSRSA